MGESRYEAGLEERALLFLCSLIRGDRVGWPSIEEDGFEESFLDQARYHGVEALVCHLVSPKPGWETFPSRLRQSLDLQTKMYVAIEMVRANELHELHRALVQSGIRALLMKGASLAFTHYKKPYLRLGVDTDIFIDLKDIRKTQDLFSGLGFQMGEAIYKSHQFTCFKQGPVNVFLAYDVHWRASNAARFSRVMAFDEAWEASITISELGGWRGLNPQHALLLACMHRAGNPHHDPDKLIWLYDVHLLVAGMLQQELIQFANRAVAKNIQEICVDAIHKAGGRFGTDVDDEVIELLSRVKMKHQAKQRFRDSQLALLADDMRNLRGLSDKLKLLKELLIPPGAYLLNKYGKQKRIWVPALYVRYLLDGLQRRLSLK